MKLITRLDPRRVEERRAQEEQLKHEINKLKDDIKDLDSDDIFERPILERKNELLKEAELKLSVVEPELALAAADRSEQTRIKHLQQEYDLAWNEFNLYYALRDTPVNEADIAVLKRRITELRNLR